MVFCRKKSLNEIYLNKSVFIYYVCMQYNCESLL